jgi:hypothetical protein
MNERIKELAEQADKEAFPHGSMAWMQTFAELIVRECAYLLDEKIYPRSHPYSSLGYKLKESFGVE